MGRYARASVPDPDGARIAILHCSFADIPNIYDRVVGFINGFGLSLQYSNPTREVDFSTDVRVTSAHQYKCSSSDSAKTAMLAALQSGDTPTVVFVTNELGGFGALAAVNEEGLEGVRIMTVDGSCNGVAEVYDRGFDANIIQQPFLMGKLGVDAYAAFLDDGTTPGDTEIPFAFAVAESVAGVETSSKEEAMESCWGSVDVEESTSRADTHNFAWPGLVVLVSSALLLVDLPTLI